MTTLRLTKRAAEPVRRGHPWVYRDQIDRAELEDGADVALDHEGMVVGHGLASATGPIAVRVWTHGDVPIDETVFRKRLSRAVALRKRWFDEATNAYRVVNGEGDRMPGLVVDRYGEAAVVVLDDSALRPHLAQILPAILDAVRTLGVRGLFLRSGRGEEKRVEHVLGEVVATRRELRESGVPLVVDIEKGQKTGAFLDQRDNRTRVGELARGRRVLNLFSYTGGFSLHAALGGATAVTSVDVAAQGHALAQETFKLAGLSPSAHEFVTQDCFSFLEQAARQKRRWDLVVSNPPSFAPNAKSVPRALAAYRSLHRACAAVLADDAIFCAASCSSHVDAAMFTSTLDDVALGTDTLRLLALHGAPCNHPTLPAFPEGRYLKFAVLG